MCSDTLPKIVDRVGHHEFQAHYQVFQTSIGQISRRKRACTRNSDCEGQKRSQGKEDDATCAGDSGATLSSSWKDGKECSEVLEKSELGENGMSVVVASPDWSEWTGLSGKGIPARTR